MVLKNIKRIKETLPNVLHVMMFYNDGTVLQTTFEPPVNIPKLGENLSEIINHFDKLKEFCAVEFGLMKNVIFEAKNMIIGIIKVGEESFIAIFMENQGEKTISFDPIKKYISRLEYLIDTDLIEIQREELQQIQGDLQDARKRMADLESLENATNCKLKDAEEEALKNTINEELKVIGKEMESLKKTIQEKSMLVEKIEGEVKSAELKWLEDKYL